MTSEPAAVAETLAPALTELFGLLPAGSGLSQVLTAAARISALTAVSQQRHVRSV